MKRSEILKKKVPTRILTGIDPLQDIDEAGYQYCEEANMPRRGPLDWILWLAAGIMFVLLLHTLSSDMIGQLHPAIVPEVYVHG